MTTFPADEIQELKGYCASVEAAAEGGRTYLLLRGLRLPEGCVPATCDALLCPTPRDNYNSRLFFDQHIQVGWPLNWNGNNVRVLDRNWHAFSWQFDTGGLRLAQILFHHLEGFTHC